MKPDHTRTARPQLLFGSCTLTRCLTVHETALPPVWRFRRPTPDPVDHGSHCVQFPTHGVRRSKPQSAYAPSLLTVNGSLACLVCALCSAHCAYFRCGPSSTYHTPATYAPLQRMRSPASVPTSKKDRTTSIRGSIGASRLHGLLFAA